jgi:NRPS condensation-like uncharacterized protein
MVMGMEYENDPHGSQGCLIAYFRGRVDRDRMENAVRLTLMAEPILRYRYVFDPGRPYWEEVEDADQDECFSRRPRSSDDQELFAFMRDPVEPSRAPQVKVCLFQSEKDALCIKVNHIAIDGGGAIQYLFLLASLYRELGRDPRHRPRAAAAIRKGPQDVLREVGPLPALAAIPKMTVPAPTLGIPATGGDRSKVSYLFGQIGPERARLLRAYAKGRSVTMNDLFLTAFCLAIFSAREAPVGQSCRVVVPVNLRRYLPPGEERTICNLAAGYFPTLDRREGEDFATLLQRAHVIMEAEKNNQVELAEMLLLGLITRPGIPLIRMVMGRQRFQATYPTLTNLGVVDPELADFGETVLEEVREVGPVLFPPNFMIGAISFRERVTFSMSFCSSAVDPDYMERFLRAFLEELPGRELGYEIKGIPTR